MVAIGLQHVIAHANRAAVEGVQAVDAAQQRRLARPAGTDQGHGLPGLDPQADVVQDRAIAESLGDVRDFHVHGVYRPFPQRRSR